jgi:hypothetical protein
MNHLSHGARDNAAARYPPCKGVHQEKMKGVLQAHRSVSIGDDDVDKYSAAKYPNVKYHHIFGLCRSAQSPRAIAAARDPD